MTSPDKINTYLKKYSKNNQLSLAQKKAYEIPDFIKIRNVREKLFHNMTELKTIEERFFNITNAANDGIIQMNEEGLIVFWNRAAETIFGYSDKEVLGVNLHTLLAPFKYKESYEKNLPLFFKKGTGPFINKTVYLDALTKDCRIIPIEISISSIKVNKKWHAIAIFRDITEKKKIENLANLNTSIIKSVNEGIMVLNEKLQIIDINPAFTSITGYNQADALGQNPDLLKSNKHDKIFYQNLWHTLLTQGSWNGEIWNRRKTGEIYPQSLSITTIRNENKETIYYIGVFSDITQRKNLEISLSKEAESDSLTGLFNRRSFVSQTNQLIKLCHRNQTKAAIVFIDIDYFKSVNDKYGHVYGDELLKQMSIRLKKSVRDSDCVARLGGDEFSLAMYDIKTNKTFMKVVQKVFKELTKPYTLINRKTNIAVSMGISIYPDDAKTTMDLIKFSDEAMYSIKKTTRNDYVFWSAIE